MGHDALRGLVLPAAIVVLAGGFYVISREVVPTGGLVAIGAGVAWVVVAGAAMAWLARRDRLVLRMVIFAGVLVAVVGGFLIAPKGSEVNENVVTAAPAQPERPTDPAKPQNVQTLTGSFEGVSGHRGTGRAAVVELADGGRMLTFRNFDVDPGAGGLRVYMVAGTPSSDGDVRDFKELAPLKGTKGNQQYKLPDSLSLKRYGTVVIWCVPFTTRIAQAPLS